MTTTDPFTDAARAEAERRNPPIDRHPDDLTYPRAALREHKRGAFVAGAEWARAHLAAQEPTDAEVRAALGAANRAALTGSRFDLPLSFYPDNVVDAIRAALSAARAARRDEEKR